MPHLGDYNHYMGLNINDGDLELFADCLHEADNPVEKDEGYMYVVDSLGLALYSNNEEEVL